MCSHGITIEHKFVSIVDDKDIWMCVASSMQMIVRQVSISGAYRSNGIHMSTIWRSLSMQQQIMPLHYWVIFGMDEVASSITRL